MYISTSKVSIHPLTPITQRLPNNQSNHISNNIHIQHGITKQQGRLRSRLVTAGLKLKPIDNTEEQKALEKECERLEALETKVQRQESVAESARLGIEKRRRGKRKKQKEQRSLLKMLRRKAKQRRGRRSWRRRIRSRQREGMR
jgi:hypothetical protein